MTNSSYTDITIVLDRSGSMDKIREQTVKSFNDFLREQQATEAGRVMLSLVQFDDRYENHYTAVTIRDVPTFEFHPRGSTALLDALGRSINDTGSRFEKMPERERPSKVMFVIITDGLENASREFDRMRVGDMIRTQQDQFAWTFMFLGANQDAIMSAQELNIPRGNAYNYAPTAKGAGMAFANMSSEVKTISVGAPTGQSRRNLFTPDQQAEQEDMINDIQGDLDEAYKDAVTNK